MQALQGLLLFLRTRGDSKKLIPGDLLLHSLEIKKIPQKIRYRDSRSLHLGDSRLIPVTPQFRSPPSCNGCAANCNSNGLGIVLPLRRKRTVIFSKAERKESKEILVSGGCQLVWFWLCGDTREHVGTCYRGTMVFLPGMNCLSMGAAAACCLLQGCTMSMGKSWWRMTVATTIVRMERQQKR